MLYGLDCFNGMGGSVAILAFHGRLVLEIARARHWAIEGLPVVISKDEKRSGRLSDLHAVGQLNILVCLFHEWQQQNGEQGNHNRN